jgi:hypothetical protein
MCKIRVQMQNPESSKGMPPPLSRRAGEHDAPREPARMLWGAIAAIGLAAAVAGALFPAESRGKLPLPCAFLEITGWPCLFCGMTRAFLAAGHGHWVEAFRQSPVGALLYVAAWAAFFAGAINLARGAAAPRTSSIPIRFWIACALALAANWIYRVLAGAR